MAHDWDEFSKLLAEPIPRRESLRRLGILFAGAVLTPLGLRTARADGGTDRCRTFCNNCPRPQRSSCLTACRGCNNDPSHLCGGCASGYSCTDFGSDVHNCGGCGNDCWLGAGVNEDASCSNGACAYACVAGAVDCNGTCTFLDSDPDNCGACGNICPATEPYCGQGVCFDPGCAPGLTYCAGACVDVMSNGFYCGSCFHSCAQNESCQGGICVGIGGGY
jgi:hypothetical protein